MRTRYLSGGKAVRFGDGGGAAGDVRLLAGLHLVAGCQLLLDLVRWILAGGDAVLFRDGRYAAGDGHLLGGGGAFLFCGHRSNNAAGFAVLFWGYFSLRGLRAPSLLLGSENMAGC